jgi:phosphodiester glycosidase
VRRGNGIATWRRVRRIVLFAAAICLVPTGLSYVSAMTGRYNVGLGVESVEWLRNNGGNGLVSQVENWYYTLTAPSKGGPPLHSLPQVGVHASAKPPPPANSHHPPAPYRPPNIRPVIHPALSGEGVWRPAAANAGRRPPVLVTTFRSSRAYPQFVAGVAWMDSGRTRLAYMPGLQEPPTLAHRGPSEVPAGLRSKVVATFNGGFPLSTSNAGLIYRGRTIAPMVNGIATLTGYRNGKVGLGAWRGGSTAGPNIYFAKQNLPLIIDRGKLNPNLSDGPQWGATVNNAIRVWRSGVGIDRHGNLIYAAANYQTVGSLAQILKRAGAVRALELDINQDWTSFITYKHPGAQDPSNLLPDMFRSPTRYLTPDDRDFFAVYSTPSHG